MKIKTHEFFLSTSLAVKLVSWDLIGGWPLSDASDWEIPSGRFTLSERRFKPWRTL